MVEGMLDNKEGGREGGGREGERERESTVEWLV